MKYLLALGYVASVVAANVLTEHLGLVPIGFGLLVTAGTFAAGATILIRNIGQDALGRPLILLLMAVGVALSWWLASPQLAVASAAAFTLSELTDMAVYTRLRQRGRGVALPAAALAGAVVDTLLFLHLAGFPVTTETVGGQVLVKVGITLAALLAGGGARAVLRQPIHRNGA